MAARARMALLALVIGMSLCLPGVPAAGKDKRPQCLKAGCDVEASRREPPRIDTKSGFLKPSRANEVYENSEGHVRTSKTAAKDPARIAREHEKQIQAALAVYRAKMDAHQMCLEGSNPVKCSYPSLPIFGSVAFPFAIATDAGDPTGPPVVTLTAEQIAYIAFARLKLTPPTPGIGPPPSINRWKMAAVGYPLWLWGVGNANPAPVSDAVGGLYVSLDAHVSKTVFTMGDGTKVTCQGAGRKWGRSVAAGQKSPNCGHIYTKPSLPKSKYTVTATTYWSVAWNVSGRTGVIPFVQSASTTLPVGELQALIR